MINITYSEDKIKVSSEYNTIFVKRAKNLQGKFNPSDKSWIFDSALKDEVLQMCKEVYGDFESPDLDKNVSLLCTCLGGYENERDPITLHGKVIAQAYGRDSGARLGNDVALIKGKFRSGGSAKHWYTICEPGTTFKLINVKKYFALKILSDKQWLSDVTLIE